ncbi:hypothetical protein JOD24_003248 [Kroppenstedtia sanguinis]|uniref:DUF4358 domain-containing protein n=1 Tax=Kroppenstedtia sanguinis TaxID=1380684 RepID=A0ABW4C815_9BACL
MKRYGKDIRTFLAVMFALAVAMSLLSGCSGEKEKAVEKLSAVEVGKRIEQEVNLDHMKPGDMSKLQKLYQIDADSIEDFILFTASSNVKADELAIIKVKDAHQIESVKEKISHRIDAQTVKFKDYRPEEFFLIDKHVLKTKGPFIFFAVSKEADQMERAFDYAF